MSATNRRKVLVPLATLLAAGAVAIGSGATFTSTTASTTSVASGNVEHTTDVSTMNISGIKPGDIITGEVTVENTGDLTSLLTLAETDATSTFIDDDLFLVLSQDGEQIWQGGFGDLATEDALELGTLAPEATTTVEWTVTLEETVDNTNEGKTATANYRWVTTQEAGNESSLFNRVTGIFNGDDES